MILRSSTQSSDEVSGYPRNPSECGYPTIFPHKQELPTWPGVGLAAFIHVVLPKIAPWRVLALLPPGGLKALIQKREKVGRGTANGL